MGIKRNNNKMNQKTIIVMLSLFVIILIGITVYFASYKNTKQIVTSTSVVNSTREDENSNDQNPTITYLISKEDKNKFCDGATMDSDGYRKTITTEVTSNVLKTGLTESELVKETAVLATDGMCQEALRQTDFNVTNGAVEIAPIEGWAGVSIAMCTCRPQVEVNLLRIPFVKQVVWLSN